MAYFAFGFDATIERHLIGKGERKLAYTVVILPRELKAELPFAEHPRLRVEGEINAHPFNGAWQPTGDGGHYLMVPKQILKEAELSVGDDVEIRFNIADQSEVEIPPALAGLLKRDRELRQKWEQLTPGKQRGFAYRVVSAKTAPTIEKRIAEVAHMIREGLSYGKGGRVR